MAHVNRRIGKSSETANVSADGTGGGVLDAFLHDYFQDRVMFIMILVLNLLLLQRPVVWS